MAWVINPFTGNIVEKLSNPPEGSSAVKNVYVDEDEHLTIEYEGD